MSEILTIKIGSNVLTTPSGTLDIERIEHIANQLADLHSQEKKVVLVSSGAVASGRSDIALPKKTDPVSERQILSSVGQVKLLNSYSKAFERFGIKCAQVLVTKEDFRTRAHYLNMQNCIKALLDNGILPIINENDAVSVTALMFTDNDELAGLIASLINADSLFILSNVDGIYNGEPGKEGVTVIPKIESTKANLSKYITTTKSNFGRGGMLTKCRIAQKTAASGISVHIANGTQKNILTDLASNPERVLHTCFVPGTPPAAVKKWMAHSEGFTKSEVVINSGAKDALFSQKANSLLLAGIIQFKEVFKKGDLIKIVDEEGHVLGIGKAQYDKEKAVIHHHDKKYKPLIHYDYLFLFPEVM